MSGEAAPGGRVSPRSPRHPLAFNGDEFLYGVWRAWLLFQCIAPASVFVSVLISAAQGVGGAAQVADVVGSAFGSTLLAGVFGLPTSILAPLIGMLPAYFLGKALRRVRDERIHIAAFAVLGLVIGVGTVVAFTAVVGLGPEQMSHVWILLVLAAGVAVPFGQFAAVRRALAADAVSGASTVPTPVVLEQDAE